MTPLPIGNGSVKLKVIFCVQAVISPLLSNLYLDPLDQQMAKQGYEMIRYADDFVILCRSEAEARAVRAEVQAWTTSAGLTLHPTKTRIVDARQPGGFDFLGYHFAAGQRWPRAKSLGKFKDTIRGKTRRTNGQSLSATIADANRTLRGWFEYFQHSRRFLFEVLDSWVRMRLRSILRSVKDARVEAAAGIIIAGPTPTLPSTGCSLWSPPTTWFVNPLGGKTTDWRAGCGKSACPVRREGDSNPIASPYPYRYFAPLGLQFSLPPRVQQEMWDTLT